jgi:hypothetical protein
MPPLDLNTAAPMVKPKKTGKPKAPSKTTLPAKRKKS